MRIIDGLNLEGCPVEIPDCSRNDFPQFLKDMGLWIGAEIGVDRAGFAKKLCKVGLRVFAIDPWLVYPDYLYLKSDQDKMERNYEKAKNVLAASDCAIIRKTSMEAVKDFADESLDFVYIDGNHGFKFVVEDIYEWSRKVKKGGIISGHDYWNGEDKFYMDVKYAVDAYTKAAHIDKWYLLGKETDIIKDDYRTWFWINI